MTAAGTIWRVCVDVGGTFTDCVAIAPDGTRRRSKTLSSGTIRARVDGLAASDTVTLAPGADVALLRGATAHGPSGGARTIIGVDEASLAIRLDGPLSGLAPSDILTITSGEPAPILAARLATRTPAGDPLPPIDLRLATTRATNALLERAYAPVALLVTEGFGDLLRIGDQRRPDLFSLSIERPAPITDLTLEIPGRLDAAGREVRPLDTDAALAAIESARSAGAEAVAICLTHAWANPEHERRVAAMARDAGFRTVVASSESAARLGQLARAQTAAIDAALAPILTRYLDEVASCLGDRGVQVLTSGAGLTPPGLLQPSDALLSGPAGGVVGAGAVGAACGEARVIAFDMGGTSTDVARLEGSPEILPAHSVGDFSVARPAVAIHTVAAGGGSICSLRDGRPAVGPASAGADPGPACYGAGGPVTITDANLLLGRIDAGRFEIPIDVAAAREAADRLIAEHGGEGDLFFAGLVNLANERMAEAIRRISVRHGYDPADHALVAFGGAGPQHACEVASRLGITRVLAPEDASLLSAVGLRSARLERTAERQTLRPLRGGEEAMEQILDELEREATDELRSEGLMAGEPDITRLISLRLAGQQDALELPASPMADLAERFAQKYGQIHGTLPAREIEVESVRVVAGIRTGETARVSSEARAREAVPTGRARVHDGEGWIEVAVHERDGLEPGDRFDGPALVTERRTATWAPAGWSGVMDGNRCLRLTSAPEAGASHHHALRSMRRELIVNRLAGIAEVMGEALRRAAISTNIRERQDYSCGVLDARGVLVSSAPHIPVHLGALGACARRMLEAVAPLGPGDVVVTNHPAFGGSHLPDVTTLEGAFDERGELLGYVMCRAHHAEIGGLAPGSMPPDARSLAEEGVPIPPTLLARAGVPDWELIERLLAGHAHPSRAVDDNIADLRSTLAASRRAAEAVAALARSAGRSEVDDTMRWIVSHTAGLVREAIARLEDLPREVTETLDGGAEIRVRIDRAEDRLTVDFAGTSPTQPGNLNAPLAVTRSAVAYVLRLLIDREVPLNDGLLEPVELRAPHGCLLNPAFGPDDAASPGVAGGNVETSQRVVEALVRAFGLAAGSQGTMNNLLLGNERFGVYETIGGGAGATSLAPGADGVHTHMTNTAITDAEALEHRHPLRVERFGIRTGSGGEGRRRGGDGLVRAITALEPVELTVVTQRRSAGAPGLGGGGAGEPGRQRVERAGGAVEALAASDRATLGAGDRVVIETPGGGGFGDPGSLEAP